MADSTGRLQTSETAVATASRIFTETVGYDYNAGYNSPRLSRPASSSSLNAQYAAYEDPGYYDGRVRRNSFNAVTGPGMISASPYNTSAMQIPPSPTNSAYGSYGQGGYYANSGYGAQYAQPTVYSQPSYTPSYVGSYPGQSVGLPVPPGGTVVIQTPSSGSRHRHRHHHRTLSGRDAVTYAISGVPGTSYSAGY